MPRNGKRYEWEVGRQSHPKLSALFQDHDWAAEVLHMRIGRHNRSYEQVRADLKNLSTSA